MTKHIIIPFDDGGCRTHSPVDDPADYNLPDNAEIYDRRSDFETRLDELKT